VSDRVPDVLADEMCPIPDIHVKGEGTARKHSRKPPSQHGGRAVTAAGRAGPATQNTVAAFPETYSLSLLKILWDLACLPCSHPARPF